MSKKKKEKKPFYCSRCGKRHETFFYEVQRRGNNEKCPDCGGQLVKRSMLPSYVELEKRSS